MAPEDKDAAESKPVKKSATKKSAAPAAKKAAKKTSATKSSTADKSAAKKTATKKSATKKAATASESTKKAPAKKEAAKKTTAKKAAPAAKKTAAVKRPGVGPSKTESAGGLLKVHHLRPAPGSRTPKTRVGRGEGSKGKTAGRGTKGTKARNQVPARLEGGQMPMHMRLPKLRGFKNPFRTEYQVVNLDRLSELYPDGGKVTVTDLVDKGAVRKGHKVKILGTGDVSVKLDVDVDAYSTKAKEKINAAGGTVSGNGAV